VDNECIKKIETRRSIRKFTGDNIPESEVLDIIRTGLSAPSAGNRQPWRIILVTEDEKKQQLASAAFGQTFIRKAAAILAICAVPHESSERYGERGATLYTYQDTAALTQTILLAAHIRGYGTCWIGAFDEVEVRKALNIPENMRPVSLIPIGKIAGDYPAPRSRRDLSEILTRESF